jgi:ABC-type bacteriocin/lantibiotic exporter with double-glycine peptidase domain
MQIKYELNPPAKATSLLRKLVALVVTAAMVGLVLMFSAVLLVIILVVGTIAGIYLWWKTRELRKQMREFSTREMAREKQTGDDEVFEGEVIRVIDPRNEK